ncbi:hypothetical protein ABZ635_22665 [Nocardiopsis sp. NPDC007018]|uniref:hypothetical protein n=1 Tax=Nocardiopsis sp. NPDC007018 TaxID=3155721 RepID=UPI0033E7E40E
MLILAGVVAFFIKNAAVDTAAMVTGKTPPSHSYRMAKLREQAARDRRKAQADDDPRGGLGMVFRHWYLDACEDLDHWRAYRHATRPERREAARRRREDRAWRIREWAAQYVPTDEDIQDAEVVDETPSPPEPEWPRPRRRRRRTTTTTEEEEFEFEPFEGVEGEVVPFGDQGEGERLPLSHRRMVLATMIADAGHTPNWEVINEMDSDQVDEAISGLIALRRGERTA